MSWVFPALKSTSHFLLQSRVSFRSGSSSEVDSSCCHRSDVWSHLESSIISINSNITGNIIRKVINIRTKNRPLRDSSINWIFWWRLPTQNLPKSSLTEERRNKAKYLTWNSIRLKFVKNTSMPITVKSLGYIKYYSSSSPRPVKFLSNSIRWNCQNICSWSRRPKTMLEIRKATFFRTFLETLLTTERRLTGW